MAQYDYAEVKDSPWTDAQKEAWEEKVSTVLKAALPNGKVTFSYDTRVKVYGLPGPWYQAFGVTQD
jgi:hypothetical protein